MTGGPIDTLLRGSTIEGRSSTALVWDGLVVEHRIAPPIERAEEDLDQHYVVLWRKGPTIADRKDVRGRFMRVVKRPGSVSLGAAGRLPAVRAKTSYDVIACVIDPVVAVRVADEFDDHSGSSVHDHLGVFDPALGSLLELAALEANENGENGRLYGDSLVHAIITRFMRIALISPRSVSPVSPLPGPRLRRVLDRMTAEFHLDLSLNELAAASGFSRAHFLRMFRAATGKTPHQYLQDVRLDHARLQLQLDAASITEIALSCGFSSHSHLTRLFRERFGATPSMFRRDHQLRIR
jgi:AraC family transcriptional regulator